MKNILIVDDHPMIRMGIEILIMEAIVPCSTHTAGTFDEAIAALRAQEMDLVVLDLSIPGGQGAEMIGKLRSVQKNVKILINTGRDEMENAPYYINMGADGFIHKSASNEEYEAALKTVLNTRKYLRNEIQQKILENFVNNTPAVNNPLELLTPRERQIMDQLLLGKWTKEVATELNLKLSTVSTHKAKILEKMEVQNVVELYKKVERLVIEI